MGTTVDEAAKPLPSKRCVLGEEARDYTGDPTSQKGHFRERKEKSHVVGSGAGWGGGHSRWVGKEGGELLHAVESRPVR